MPRFMAIDSDQVWLEIRGNINKLCGDVLTDLRTQAPLIWTWCNFVRVAA
jgi:hypothetical protein